MERAARINYKRYINAATLLGADFVSSPSTPEEYDYILGELGKFYTDHHDTAVPVYPRFNSTFGFSPDERARGIVDVDAVLAAVYRRAPDWPVRRSSATTKRGDRKLAGTTATPFSRNS